MPFRSALMAFALLCSWASMLAHNLYELPLTPVDVENAGPLAVAAGLALAHARHPCSRVVFAGALAWGVLNLVIGGIVTALPLSVLPFTPEQSPSHYAAHVVYAVGQVPLVVAAYRALAASAQQATPRPREAAAR